MANIFINGLNSKTGGGKSILHNYLSLISKNNSTNYFFILTPNRDAYAKYSSENITIIDIQYFYKIILLYPILNRFVLPYLIKKLKIDLIFNLADIIIPTDVKQIFVFDWAYAVYPKSIVWRRMDTKSLLTRKIKLFFFKRYLHQANIILAQSPTMKQRLKSLYGLNNVEIVPNAVSLENLSGGAPFDFKLPKERIKLLYLTHYYPHKNLEIFLPLAKKIQDHDLPYCIIITIDGTQHKKAASFLQNIKSLDLENVIINVNSVSMKRVPSLYKQCDALLMPTLLESFSGTYVEAMYHGIPIFTSDIDFATDVCDDAAIYFDPLDVNSILDSIIHTFDNKTILLQKIKNGKKRLGTFLSWEQAYNRYQYFLDKLNKS